MPRLKGVLAQIAVPILWGTSLLFQGPPGAVAQVHAGRIVGTVYDPNNAVVANAKVAVTNAATGVSQTVAADATGSYVFTPLEPGTYNLSASAQGFQTSLKTGVTIEVGEAVRVDLSLKLGQTSQVVEVRASAPLLNTESATLGQVITNRQLEELPLNGRGYYLLAQLTPGAAQLPGTGNVLRIRPEYINGTTISGIRGRMITYLLDGFDITEQHQGGTYIQTSIDAVQEFKVQQNGYTAEYSRSGAILNATSKAGGNTLHGGLLEFFRNDALDAKDYFATTREPLKQNQFGADIGGPVTIPGIYHGHDRTFFFSDYEGMRQRQGLVFNDIVPTPAEKMGDFSAPGLHPIYDPTTTTTSGGATTRTAFAGNKIPTGQLSQAALFFLKYLPDPNNASGTFEYAPARRLTLDQFTARIDETLTQSNQLYGRWSFFNNNQSDPNAYPALGYALLHTRGQDIAVNLTSTFSSNKVNVVRFNYLPSIIRLDAFQQGPNFNQQAGITGFEQTLLPTTGGSFPDFSWSGDVSSMQGSQFDQRPKTQDRKAYSATDNMTWVKGRNIFKYGVLYRYYQWLGTDSAGYVGSWTFSGINTNNPASPAGTGSPFADFLLGYPASGFRAYPGATFGGQANYWQFFFQDDIKVTNKLTLNVGLRYEHSPWASGYRGQLGTFNPSLYPSSKPVIDASNTDQLDLGAQYAAPTAFQSFGFLIQTSHQAGLPYNITHNDNRQWAPRIGLAWQPFGPKTVVRGGYGIYYEPENTDGRVNKNMIPYSLQETEFNTANSVPQRAFDDFFLGQPLGPTSPPSITPTPVNMRMGQDQHWSFGIQQQLSENMAVEVNYVGNKSTFLNSNIRINDPPAGPGSVQTRRPYNIFGTINYDGQDGTSIYHALQASLRRHYSSGFWFLGSYTFSSCLQRNQQAVLGGDGFYEKYIADIDVPQNFAFSAGYELPFGKGKPFMGNAGKLAEGLIGGWQVQGVLDLHTGRPYTPTVGRDVANIGLGGQRPIRKGSGKLSHPTLSKWFDTSAFTVPANYTYGNSGTNILFRDFNKDFDFSLFKNFQVTERTRLEFRAEFFNLTNTPVFDAPVTNIDGASAGRVTSTANTPRQIQFALKLNF